LPSAVSIDSLQPTTDLVVILFQEAREKIRAFFAFEGLLAFAMMGCHVFESDLFGAKGAREDFDLFIGLLLSENL
jgi:hypothetical protein